MVNVIENHRIGYKETGRWGRHCFIESLREDPEERER